MDEVEERGADEAMETSWTTSAEVDEEETLPAKSEAVVDKQEQLAAKLQKII